MDENSELGLKSSSFSREGSLLAMGSYENKIILINKLNNRIIKEFTHQNKVENIVNFFIKKGYLSRN
jgi:hypothetical protein